VIYLKYVSWYVGSLGALMLVFYVIVYAKLIHQRQAKNVVVTTVAHTHADKNAAQRKKVERSLLFQVRCRFCRWIISRRSAGLSHLGGRHPAGAQLSAHPARNIRRLRMVCGAFFCRDMVI